MAYGNELLKKLQQPDDEQDTGLPPIPMPKNGNTGVSGLAGTSPSPQSSFLPEPMSGGTAGPAVSEPAPAPAGPAPDFLGKMRGWEAGKIGAQGQTPKYAIAQAIRDNDPSKGITPELLAELNGLGIGTFSDTGSSGKLRIGGNKDPYFEDSDILDLVTAANSGDPNAMNWWWGLEDEPGGGPPQGGGGGGLGAPMMGGGLSPLLQGDPSAGIQSALGQFTDQGEFFKQLMAQLGAAR